MGTSLLQRNTVKQLDRIYGCHAVQENVRPEWLRGPNGHRLELDVFVATAKVAIEVQGPQHYRFSEHFHRDASGFEDQIQRDRHKRIICSKRGITLYEVSSHSDLQGVLAKLKNKPTRPDPKHVVRDKELFRQGQQRAREDYVLWKTRRERRRVEEAIGNLKAVIATLPSGVEHSAETDRASAALISRRNRLVKATARARRRIEGDRGRGRV